MQRAASLGLRADNIGYDLGMRWSSGRARVAEMAAVGRYRPLMKKNKVAVFMEQCESGWQRQSRTVKAKEAKQDC